MNKKIIVLLLVLLANITTNQGYSEKPASHTINNITANHTTNDTKTVTIRSLEPFWSIKWFKKLLFFNTTVSMNITKQGICNYSVMLFVVERNTFFVYYSMRFKQYFYNNNVVVDVNNLDHHGSRSYSFLENITYQKDNIIVEITNNTSLLFDLSLSVVFLLPGNQYTTADYWIIFSLSFCSAETKIDNDEEIEKTTVNTIPSSFEFLWFMIPLTLYMVRRSIKNR